MLPTKVITSDVSIIFDNIVWFGPILLFKGEQTIQEQLNRHLDKGMYTINLIKDENHPLFQNVNSTQRPPGFEDYDLEAIAFMISYYDEYEC
jgi:hypothetical protein